MSESLIMVALVVIALALTNWCWLKTFRAAEDAHRKERSELYSRLMARDLADYMALENRELPRGRNFVKRGLDESARNLAAQAAVKQ